jgi:hypothetical protein
MRQLILAGTVAFFATVHFSVAAENTSTKLSQILRQSKNIPMVYLIFRK